MKSDEFYDICYEKDGPWDIKDWLMLISCGIITLVWIGLLGFGAYKLIMFFI